MAEYQYHAARAKYQIGDASKWPRDGAGQEATTLDHYLESHK